MIIGITGKSGSGKNTYAEFLKQFDVNIAHIDFDVIGHRVLLQPRVKEELIKAFGETILENDKIDRKKLADLVFNNRENHDILTQITWERMQNLIDSDIENHIKNYETHVILNWILLPKSKYLEKCDVKILMKCPDDERYKRIHIRDKLTREKFDERDSASIEYDEKLFDYIIEGITI